VIEQQQGTVNNSLCKSKQNKTGDVMLKANVNTTNIA
jgi:hypothetical protein